MKSKIHSEWIDIFRGLSALAVVIYHARIDLWVGWQAISASPQQYSMVDRVCALLSIPTPFFGSAVMLFFLISGFCVHLPYVSNNYKFEASSYVYRRFFRVYPPYLATIVLCVGIEALLGGCFDYPTSTLEKVISTSFMVQNYGNSSGQLISNPSLWSLPVEVELYLMYPVFLYLLTRSGLAKSMTIVALTSGMAFALVLSHAWGSGGYYVHNNFAIYWVIWCVGAVLAEGFMRRTLPAWKFFHYVILGILLATSIYTTLKKLPDPFQSWAWGASYSVIMLWALTRTGKGNCSIDESITATSHIKQIFIALGNISYSLYLVHFPLLLLVGAIWVENYGSKPSNFLITVAFSFLTIPCAALFHKYFEVPSHNLARKFGKPSKNNLL